MPLAEIVQLVDDKVRSLVLGDLADEMARHRAIGQAVLQYSLDVPRAMVADVAHAGGRGIALPAGWVDEQSQLDQVEWPVGEVPMQTVEAAMTFSGSVWSILLADSLPAGSVRLHYTAPHTLSDEECTVPVQHENALACWAAAELCRQLATQKGHERDATIGAAATNGQGQSGDLARRAKDWLTVYRATLGLVDPEKAAGPRPSGTTVSFVTDRRRGRFNSLGV